METRRERAATTGIKHLSGANVLAGEFLGRGTGFVTEIRYGIIVYAWFGDRGVARWIDGVLDGEKVFDGVLDGEKVFIVDIRAESSGVIQHFILDLPRDLREMEWELSERISERAVTDVYFAHDSTFKFMYNSFANTGTINILRIPL